MTRKSVGTRDNKRFEQLVLTEDSFINTLDPRYPVEYLRVRDHATEGWIFHPRILGMYPWTTQTLHQFTLNALFSPQDRKIVDVRKELQDGSEVWKVTSRRETFGSTVTVWIDPAKGPSVVRISSEGAQGEKSAHCDLELTCAKFGKKGYWYPAKVTYRSWDGKKLLHHEETATVSAEFDKEIPDSTFRLGSLGLPPGRAVLIDNWKKATWDGQELLDGISPPGAPLEPQSKNWPAGLHVAFGVAAAAAPIMPALATRAGDEIVTVPD